MRHGIQLLTRDWTCTPALRLQNLNHWTAREVLTQLTSLISTKGLWLFCSCDFPNPYHHMQAFMSHLHQDQSHLNTCQHQHYLALDRNTDSQAPLQTDDFTVILQGQCSNHWWFWCTLVKTTGWTSKGRFMLLPFHQHAIFNTNILLNVYLNDCLKVNPILSLALLWLFGQFF